MDQSKAKRRTRFCQIALFAATMAPGVRILADNIDWNATSGDWFNSGNWTDATASRSSNVPTSSDNAYLQNGGTISISGGAARAGYLELDSSGLTLSAGNLVVSNGDERIGNSGSASFTQTGGGNLVSGGDFSLIMGFNSGSAGTYSLSGGTVTASQSYVGLLGNGTFSQSGGTLSLGSLFTGLHGAGTFTESGGTASVSDMAVAPDAGSTGTVNISGGTLLTTDTSIGGYWFAGEPAGGSGILTIAGNGSPVVTVSNTLQVWNQGLVQWDNGSLSVSSLTLTGGGKMSLGTGSGRVLRLQNLSIDSANGSVLDLADNSMSLDYTGTSPITSIRSLLSSGFANGAWNGSGISSSAAATVALNANNSHKTAIGYAEASALGIGTFGGQSVDSTTVLLRYTDFGDANLDGTVNSSDFALLAANFGKAGEYWNEGDFNYDGTVNALDFNALASNYGQVESASLPEDFSATTVGVLVPEPDGAGWLIAAASLLIVGGRRRMNGLCGIVAGA